MIAYSKKNESLSLYILEKKEESSLTHFYIILIHVNVSYQYVFETHFLYSIDFFPLEKANTATLKSLSERH